MVISCAAVIEIKPDPSIAEISRPPYHHDGRWLRPTPIEAGV
jgi:hypothetical protein